uniref:C2H2-type domain-containing protein n=1 Tax=Otus sunia TaxID=257818 RepID=A0A8C8B4G6_9STRI
ISAAASAPSASPTWAPSRDTCGDTGGAGTGTTPAATVVPAPPPPPASTSARCAPRSSAPFAGLESLREHSRGHRAEEAAALADVAGGERRPYACGVCGKTYRHGGSLVNHRQTHQTGVFPCAVCAGPPVCGRSYKHAGSLVNHRQTHTTGLFRCAACHKAFYNLMALKNHRRTHAERRRHRCGLCPKAFRLRRQLLGHQRLHPPPDGDLQADAAEPAPEEPWGWGPPMCP